MAEDARKEKCTFEGNPILSFHDNEIGKEGMEVKDETIISLCKSIKKTVPVQSWNLPTGKKLHSPVKFYSQKGAKKLDKEYLEKNQEKMAKQVKKSIPQELSIKADMILARTLEIMCDMILDSDEIVLKNTLTNKGVEEIFDGNKDQNGRIYEAITFLGIKGVIKEFEINGKRTQLLLTGSLFPPEEEWQVVRSNWRKGEYRKRPKKKDDTKVEALGEPDSETSEAIEEEVVEEQTPPKEEIEKLEPNDWADGIQLKEMDPAELIQKAKDNAKKYGIFIENLNINLINISK